MIEAPKRKVESVKPIYVLYERSLPEDLKSDLALIRDPNTENAVAWNLAQELIKRQFSNYSYRFDKEGQLEISSLDPNKQIDPDLLENLFTVTRKVFLGKIQKPVYDRNIENKRILNETSMKNHGYYLGYFQYHIFGKYFHNRKK